MIPPAIALAAVLSLLTFDQWSTAIGLAVVIGGVIIAIPSRRSLAVWKGNAEADRRRADGIQKDLEGAIARAATAEGEARRCSDQVIHWKAKYDEQERYTAQGALEQVAAQMAKLQTAIVTAIQASNDLELQTHAVLEDLNRQLKRNGDVLEQLVKAAE